MAASATEVLRQPLGPRFMGVIATVAMDSSYAGSGGETLDLSGIFDNAVWGGIPIEYDAEGLYILRYDLAASGAPATGKVIALWGDYDAGADADLVEVTATTDLSGLSGYWLFFGY